MAVAKPKGRRSGVVVPSHLRWDGRLGAFVIQGLMRSVMSTWRVTVQDPYGFLLKTPCQPVIFTLWHNRLAHSMWMFQNIFVSRQPEIRMAALISASRDGAMLAKTLSYFNVDAIRGSTSRRGPQALIELASAAREGKFIAITPDGPRGPKYHLQSGIISLAQLTGLPILPLTVNTKSKIVLKSWDGFQIPYPFSQSSVIIGPLLHVARRASDEEREQARQTLEDNMRKDLED